MKAPPIPLAPGTIAFITRDANPTENLGKVVTCVYRSYEHDPYFGGIPAWYVRCGEGIFSRVRALEGSGEIRASDASVSTTCIMAESSLLGFAVLPPEAV